MQLYLNNLFAFVQTFLPTTSLMVWNYKSCLLDINKSIGKLILNRFRYGITSRNAKYLVLKVFNFFLIGTQHEKQPKWPHWLDFVYVAVGTGRIHATQLKAQKYYHNNTSNDTVIY